MSSRDSDQTEWLPAHLDGHGNPVLSVLFRERAHGEDTVHLTVQVFAGPDADHRALCGELVFREPEWAALWQALAGSSVVARGVELERQGKFR